MILLLDANNLITLNILGVMDIFNPDSAIEKSINFVAKFLIHSVREKRRLKFDLSFTNKEITPWGGMVSEFN